MSYKTFAVTVKVTDKGSVKEDSFLYIAKDEKDAKTNLQKFLKRGIIMDIKQVD